MQDLEAAVYEIQRGNERLREELISSQKEFIHKYTCFICKSRLEWQNDDELSITLIAFNRAIDTFDAARNNNFLAYARLLMRNSLVDYFRSREKFQPVSIESGRDEVPSLTEVAASRESYLREIESRETAYEVQIFKDVLAKFGLSLRELVKKSPCHRDTREQLKKAVERIAREPGMVNTIYRSKRLPLQEIQLLTGVKRKTLQKWRQYLLSLIIILTSGEMESLVEYIWGRRMSGQDGEG